MATPTRAGFRSAYPEFSTKSDAEVDRWLGRARGMHDQWDEATYALTAHLLALTDFKEGEIEGELTYEQVGQRIAQYQTQSSRPGDEFFATTSHGRRFLEMERRTARAAYPVFVC